jgi:hypothetical protein
MVIKRFWQRFGIHKPVRFWIHFPVGMIAPLLVLTHSQGWAFCLGYLVLFVVYEVIEDWRCRDLGYTDVQGGIAGIAAGGLVVYLISLA